MSETTNIEVYCDTTDGERDVFGVVSEHPPDLPATTRRARAALEREETWAKRL